MKNNGFTGFCILLILGRGAAAADFASDFAATPDRVWIGPEYWANPMEDWRVRHGRLASGETA